MKEIKSIKVNYKLLIFSLFFTFSLLVDGDSVLLNIYTVPILVILILLSFYQIIINREGISKKTLIIPFFKTVKKWREIKYYVTVVEYNSDHFSNYNSGYKSALETTFLNSIFKQKTIRNSLGQILKISNCLWFIDQQSKVCLRLDIDKYSNSDEILKSIQINEISYGDEFEVNEPSFPIIGYKKFNEIYFPRNSEELALLENKLTEPEKIKLKNLRKRKENGDKVYLISRDLGLNMFFDKTE
ncbi:MAG: hypothetical protein EVA39_06435 [Flavobacteriales bacterium]|nr:hypothetical protein [Flavobacteriaceae bacterium]RZP07169.1 MAG: hypothetical protein EVA39_06435 [Flavobacteriales bacterium]|tara:strand:- start:50 stop:778 length:729 start_codon:yes stop_codon:yes gene_type:complete